MNNKLNQNQIQAWLSEIDNLLVQDNISSQDENHIHILLDKVIADDSDNYQAKQLRKQLTIRARQQHERRVYERTLQECQSLWDREPELVSAYVASSEILEICYSHAIRISETAVGHYPDSSLLRGLVRQSTIARNNARNRYEVRSTAEEIGDFHSMIEQLREEQDKSKLLPWVNVRGEECEPITIAEAINEAELLAVNFAEQKAEAYLDEAIQYIANHAPRSAKKVLFDSHNLFMLDDESRGICDHYLRNVVEPAIQQLERAERLLKRAESAPDLEEEWNLLEQAVDAYPYMARLQGVRTSLARRAMAKAETIANTLQVAVKFNRQQDEMWEKSQQVSHLVQLSISAPENEEIEAFEAQGKCLQDRVAQLINTFENHARLSQEVYALLGRGRQFLDSEEYEAAAHHFCEAESMLSEVTDFYVAPKDKVAIRYFCVNTKWKNELVVSAKDSLKQAKNAIRRGDSCVAFDILSRVPKFDFDSEQSDTLQKRISELQETVLRSCASKLASVGNYPEAEDKLILSSNPKEARAELLSQLSQQERENRINKWDENLVSIGREVTVWFRLSIIASALSLIVFGVAFVLLLTGQVSTGIITMVASILPSFITKIVFNQYRNSRAEINELLEKPTHEINQEDKVWDTILVIEEE